MQDISDEHLVELGKKAIALSITRYGEMNDRREVLRATIVPMGAMGAMKLPEVPQRFRPLVEAMLRHWINSDQPKKQEAEMQHGIKTLSDRIEGRKRDLDVAKKYLRELNDDVSLQISRVREIESKMAELEQAICVLKDANNEL